ncbi:MAG: metal-dependent transcriptional regulator [Lachnospiraceae bacterium]|nr:metal-dependent transcriptional regulator [Robinsoniella sp.]MDY3767380.1 metal-dependent transcriptional regulator [Lachnospiraceae bacterium]
MHESGENYLETILILKTKKAKVRSVDIARELGYSKASVSYGIALLKQEGCVTVKKGGSVELTEKGHEIAQRIYERHQTLTSFFEIYAKVPRSVAEKDACKVEHILSEDTYQGLKKTVGSLLL